MEIARIIFIWIRRHVAFFGPSPLLSAQAAALRSNRRSFWFLVINCCIYCCAGFLMDFGF